MSVQHDECSSCGEEMANGECVQSERSCGHHCNHSWSHDSCCWCKFEAENSQANAEE